MSTRGKGVSGVVVAPVGNLLAAPSPTAPVVAQLAQGREVILTGRTARADWFQTLFDNGTVWISATEIEVRGNFADLLVVDAGGNVVQPPPPPPPPPPPQAPWRAEYFANPDLRGPAQVVRGEQQINYNWHGAPPAPGMPGANWSARWTGSFWFEGGNYRFHARVDDGVRIRLDSIVIIEEWYESSEQMWSSEFKGLGAGQHTVTVEYLQLGGNSSCAVMWERTG